MKNQSLQENWPFALAQGQQAEYNKGTEVRKIDAPQKLRMSLGIKVYGTNVQEPAEAVLSHHFVPNTYREGKLAKLDSIISLGEYEETEQRGLDTP